MASATICIGLGFGDEGKGSTVDYLTRHHKASLVVRFNGGAQAGHNVITPHGRHHCFSQWGSGTFAGARTFLSRFMMVNPIFALSEAKHLQHVGVADPLALLTVEREALITTPFHVAANRIAELSRSNGLHGSCGMGIGQTAEDALARHDDVVRVSDLLSSGLTKKLRALQRRKLAEARASGSGGGNPLATVEMGILEDPSVPESVFQAYSQFAHRVQLVDERWLPDFLDYFTDHVIFEGAQGVLLDEWWGFHPHTTWSTCTFDNAMQLLQGTDTDVRRLGVLRVFHTRHGTGPFPTGRADFGEWTKDDHNVHTPWQHGFRAGPFDMVLARYALDAVGGCDGLVFTHLDKLEGCAEVPVCWAYGHPDHIPRLPQRRPADLKHQEELCQFLKTAKPNYIEQKIADPRGHAEFLAASLRTPLALVSEGPTAKDKVSPP